MDTIQKFRKNNKYSNDKKSNDYMKTREFSSCFNTLKTETYFGGNQFHKHVRYLVGICKGNINFVNIDSREIERTIDSKTDPFVSFAIHKNGLITSTLQGALKFWNVEEKTCVKSYKIIIKDVKDIALNFDNSLCSILIHKNFIYIFSLAKGYVINKFTPNSAEKISKTIFSAEFLFCLGEKGAIIIYNEINDVNNEKIENNQNNQNKNTVTNIKTNKKSKSKMELKNHFGPVTSLRWNVTGNLMLSSSRDKVVTLWDLSLLRKRKKFFGTLPPKSTFLIKEEVEDILMVNEEDILNGFYYCGNSGTISYFDTKKGVVTRKSPILSSLRTMRLHSLENFEKTKEMVALTEELDYYVLKDVKVTEFYPTRLETLDEVISIPNTSQIAFIDNTSIVKIMSVETFKTVPLIGHEANVTSIDTDSKGEIIVTGDKSGSIRLWSQSNNECIGKTPKNISGVASIAIFKHSNKIKSTLNPQNPPNPPNPSKSSILPNLNKNTNIMAVLHENGNLHLWIISIKNFQNENEKQKKQNSFDLTLVRSKENCMGKDKGNCVDVSHKGEFISTGGMGNYVRVFRTDGLEFKGDLKGHRRSVWEVKFSPVENLLASSSGDKTVKLWSVTKMNCLKSFEGHKGTVYGCFFDRTGSTLISFSKDSAVKFWNTRSSLQLEEQESAVEEGKLVSATLIEIEQNKDKKDINNKNNKDNKKDYKDKINNKTDKENKNNSNDTLVTMTSDSIFVWTKNKGMNKLDEFDEKIESPCFDGKKEFEVDLSGNNGFNDSAGDERDRKVLFKEKFQRYLRNGMNKEAFLIAVEGNNEKMVLDLMKIDGELLLNNKMELGKFSKEEINKKNEFIKKLISIIFSLSESSKTANAAQQLLDWTFGQVELRELYKAVTKKEIVFLSDLCVKRLKRSRDIVRDSCFLKLFTRSKKSDGGL